MTRDEKVAIGIALPLLTIGIAMAFRPIAAVKVYGTVVDSESLDPIAGVEITINAHTTTSNDGGDYSLALSNPGEYLVRASKIGYSTWERLVELTEGDNKVNIFLTEISVNILSLVFNEG